jgi:hypothetical protein
MDPTHVYISNRALSGLEVILTQARERLVIRNQERACRCDWCCRMEKDKENCHCRGVPWEKRCVECRVTTDLAEAIKCVEKLILKRREYKPWERDRAHEHRHPRPVAAAAAPAKGPGVCPASDDFPGPGDDDRRGCVESRPTALLMTTPRPPGMIASVIPGAAGPSWVFGGGLAGVGLGGLDEQAAVRDGPVDE